VGGARLEKIRSVGGAGLVLSWAGRSSAMSNTEPNQATQEEGGGRHEWSSFAFFCYSTGNKMFLGRNDWVTKRADLHIPHKDRG